MNGGYLLRRLAFFDLVRLGASGQGVVIHGTIMLKWVSLEWIVVVGRKVIMRMRAGAAGISRRAARGRGRGFVGFGDMLVAMLAGMTAGLGRCPRLGGGCGAGRRDFLVVGNAELVGPLVIARSVNDDLDPVTLVFRRCQGRWECPGV